MGKTFVNTT